MEAICFGFRFPPPLSFSSISLPAIEELVQACYFFPPFLIVHLHLVLFDFPRILKEHKAGLFPALLRLSLLSHSCLPFCFTASSSALFNLFSAVCELIISTTQAKEWPAYLQKGEKEWEWCRKLCTGTFQLCLKSAWKPVDVDCVQLLCVWVLRGGQKEKERSICLCLCVAMFTRPLWMCTTYVYLLQLAVQWPKMGMCLGDIMIALGHLDQRKMW